MFLDQADLDFRRDRTEFLYALLSREARDGRVKSDIKRQLIELGRRPGTTMAPEEIEGLIERLGLQAS